MNTTRNDSEKRQLCSICIANYNGENVLADCLDSLFSQRGAIPFEVIIHDDASTDGSLRLLRENYPEVVVIESNVNVGFCISNNRMVERTRGDYVLLLNNDATLKPDALATLFEHARQQTPQGILTLPQYDWQTGELVDRGCLLDPFYNPIPNLSPDRCDVAMVIGACLWLPRSLWYKIGGFPEWMESIAEDMYLCCLARLYGYPVQVTKSSGYRHWQGMSFSGKRTNRNRLVSTYRRRFLSERNKTITMLVACPVFLLPIVFPVHMIVLGIEGLMVALLTENSRLFVKVYWPLPHSIWKYRKHINQQRRQIHRRRSIKSSIFLSAFRWLPWKLKMLCRFGLPQVR